ncbi:MAG: CHAT domain-containing protein [Spirulina sp. SIO3F2]|nr:CHAT domain-containing protein [Spirulina sp. SIO3F2]
MMQSTFWLGGTVALSLTLAAPALAQSITAAPDGTGTAITIDGSTYQIQGGTQAGANLFHSFQDFGLSTGAIANFLSDPGINNIFGRVVGGNASIIDGLIQANPNLYLMNPAGIVFGANAQLNVGGDFFATTADQICFEGGCFNSVGLNDYSTLAGSPTTLGFLQSQSGGLINAGTLEVLKGKSIHLSGGTVVSLGQIAAPGGNAIIAAIPGERRVQLNTPGSLLSLEMTDEVLTEGINPLALPELLTGSGRGNPPVVALNPAGVSTGALPLQGDVVVEGEIAAEQIDLYAIGQLTPSDPDLIQGNTRVVRFSETGENPDQAVFIDARADNPEDLLFGAAAGTVSQIIEPNANGVAVVSEQLAVISKSVGELDSVAIVAEGNQGNFWLGNQWIRAENVGDYATQLQTWGNTLTSNADILIYSCFTALGATGEALLTSIAEMTGADVAASVNVTGSGNYGGDWVLEATTGTIEATNPFSPETLSSWDGKLATLTVQSADDIVTNDGVLTLREALLAANGDTTIDGVTGSGTDTIIFDTTGVFATPQTITTDGTLGEFSITDDVVIMGTGQNNLFIDGNNTNRVFNISADNVTLQDLTIQNGSTTDNGGGIYSNNLSGTLTLLNTTVSGNTGSSNSSKGGGIGSRGAVTLTNSIVSGNLADLGGGVYSRGDLTLNTTTISNNVAGGIGGGISSFGTTISLTNSTVSDNSAGGGGGIHTFLSAISDLILTNSTVSRNTSGSSGGGIQKRDGGNLTLINSTVSDNSAGGNGGGIVTYSNGGGNITLLNSTISGNSTSSAAGGGVFGRPTTITNSTISGNYGRRAGGGIVTFGGLTLTNSTVSNNTLVADPSSSNYGGGGIFIFDDAVTLNNSVITGNQDLIPGNNSDSIFMYDNTSSLAANFSGDVNLELDAKGPVNISSTGGDVNLALDATGPVNISSSGSVTLTGTANTNSNPFTINAGSGIDLTDLALGNTFGGDITLTAGSDINTKNLFTYGTGTSGNITLTSTNGSINTINGGAVGSIDTRSGNGNGGNVTLKAAQNITVGPINTEAQTGAGGSVTLESDAFVTVNGTVTSTFVNFPASISTAGKTAGGAIQLRHGGHGFTVGDARLSGTSAAITNGAQTIFPHTYLLSGSQPGIQISTNGFSGTEIATVVAGVEPINQTVTTENLIRAIGTQAGGETQFQLVETEGEVSFDYSWDLPGEKSLGGSMGDNEIFQEFVQLDLALSEPYQTLDGEAVEISEDGEDNRNNEDSVANIRETFQRIQEQTGTVPALIYALSQPDALELIVVTPDNQLLRKVVPEAERETLRRTIRTFRRRITSVSPSYLEPAQQLYNWLIRPVESSISNLNIDTLVFAMGDGLRSIPMAALHDGDQFLIEKYSLGQIPSLSLTDSSYVPLHDANVLAMGASQFDQLNPLPAVPSELNVVNNLKAGEQYLNPAFTWENLATQSREHNFEIVHLATHAAFRPGSATNSYIQLWGDDQIGVEQLRELRWFEDPKVELLVLSACQTALGDPHAELGFAGLAVQAGVKTTLASLWQISDLGTMRLMQEFYAQLNDPGVTIKAEALRQAQLALLREEATAENGLLAGITLPPELARYADTDLTHPFYWSAFTLVGSPW